MTTIFTTDSGDEYVPETPEPGTPESLVPETPEPGTPVSEPGTPETLVPETPESVPGSPLDDEDLASTADTHSPRSPGWHSVLHAADAAGIDFATPSPDFSYDQWNTLANEIPWF